MALTLASVAETSLFAKFKVLEGNTNRQKFTHGQYEGCGIQGTFGVANCGKLVVDDHQVRCVIIIHSYVQLRFCF